MGWKDQFKGDQFLTTMTAPRRQGNLVVETLSYYVTAADGSGRGELVGTFPVNASRWVTLTGGEIQWRESEESSEEENQLDTQERLANVASGLKDVGAGSEIQL